MKKEDPPEDDGSFGATMRRSSVTDAFRDFKGRSS